MALSAKQAEELSKPLDKSRVVQRKQGNFTLDYVEGWHVISEANRIFGFDGWHRETIEMREVRAPQEVSNSYGKKTWRVGFIAKVRVTVGNIIREGTGYGSGALPDLGEAYESAVKEAETDAMKRALMTFGNPFGLALYDKAKAGVSENGDTPEPKAARQVPPSAKSNKAIDARQEPAKALSKDELRVLYERLSKANSALDSLEKFDGFWSHQKTIAAVDSLQSDWKRELLAERSDKAAELQEKHDRAATDNDFPGDF